MEQIPPPRIICLTYVYDQHYHDLRGEKVEHILTTPFRQTLLRCLETASGREMIVLSSPPKALERRAGKWLPAVETKYSTHRQFFCCNWDIPKLRIALAWFFYARHVLRHVRSGDLVVIDNYEFISIVAARLLALFRRVTFVLVYLDGKHLVDRSWPRVLSWLAETLGRPILNGALLANPALGKRLLDAIPKELVPGFVPNELPLGPGTPDKEVRFMYGGGLDHAHGVDLLLESLNHLPEQGWHLLIAGQGPLAESVIRLTQNPRWRGRVEHQYPPPPEVFNRWLAEAHVGISCQRTSDPLSSGTFPSKVFTYLSAGLPVISSKSGGVEQVCGNACCYYDEETPQALAAAMKEAIENYAAIRRKLNPSAVCKNYSFQASAIRIRRMLKAMGVVN